MHFMHFRLVSCARNVAINRIAPLKSFKNLEKQALTGAIHK